MAGRKLTKDSRGGRKSEVITIRLDPRLKYLAELAARRQRRPLSSFVEWAIELSLDHLRPSYENCDQSTFADVASSLWDVDDADRFAKLAFRYPELLTHDEQVLWKLIRESGFFWRGRYNKDRQWEWEIKEASLVKERLRTHWSVLLKVTSGDLPPDTLPQIKPVADQQKTDIDDEIPF